MRRVVYPGLALGVAGRGNGGSVEAEGVKQFDGRDDADALELPQYEQVAVACCHEVRAASDGGCKHVSIGNVAKGGCANLRPYDEFGD